MSSSAQPLSQTRDPTQHTPSTYKNAQMDPKLVYLGPLYFTAERQRDMDEKFASAQMSWSRLETRAQDVKKDAMDCMRKRLRPLFANGTMDSGPWTQKLTRIDTLESIKSTCDLEFVDPLKLEAALKASAGHICADPTLIPSPSTEDLFEAVETAVAPVMDLYQILLDSIQAVKPPSLWRQGCGGRAVGEAWPTTVELQLSDQARRIMERSNELYSLRSPWFLAEAEQAGQKSQGETVTDEARSATPTKPQDDTRRSGSSKTCRQWTSLLRGVLSRKTEEVKPRPNDDFTPEELAMLEPYVRADELRCRIKAARLSLDAYSLSCARAIQETTGQSVGSMRSLYTVYGENHRERSSQPFPSVAGDSSSEAPLPIVMRK